ncbi:type I-F CRISPR-associated endoribonuclease Cas6/Csy4 [Aliikangiella maris]|uniref:Type I-F CRISPR-associated endoribonuclease Cas6/Csy4 n=2 Tax=Aliikangiella maris TaxID=3162458 RepID=A0ABV3MNL5_9GAMM
MDNYIDLKILPDFEFKTSMLMNALFSKFHRVLVEIESSNIAVSFPNYGINEIGKKDQCLGNVMRIHGEKISLELLMDKNWLKGMSDHIFKSEITKVPDTSKFISVRRAQNKYSNIEKLRRRYMSRHNVTYEEAERLYPESLVKRVKLPFVRIKSSSTGELFPLFIEQKEGELNSSSRGFNCYGLSKDASLPLF